VRRGFAMRTDGGRLRRGGLGVQKHGADVLGAGCMV